MHKFYITTFDIRNRSYIHIYIFILLGRLEVVVIPRITIEHLSTFRYQHRIRQQEICRLPTKERRQRRGNVFCNYAYIYI